MHLDRKPATTGLPPVPALPQPARVTRTGSPVATGRDDPAFTTVLGTDMAIGPERVARGVDVRSEGRNDVHVWSSSAVVTRLRPP